MLPVEIDTGIHRQRHRFCETVRQQTGSCVLNGKRCEGLTALNGMTVVLWHVLMFWGNLLPPSSGYKFGKAVKCFSPVIFRSVNDCHKWRLTLPVIFNQFRCDVTSLINRTHSFVPFAKEYYTFTAQWLLYVLAGLTFTNSTFCPHSVFMCFVWISEQTAIISLYSIKWLVFITETECVYCAVQAVYIYT
jgi:hypothetical protein